jgi:hypothetical protein
MVNEGRFGSRRVEVGIEKLRRTCLGLESAAEWVMLIGALSQGQYKDPLDGRNEC